MDEVLASAAAKLATTEHPIAVPRHKYRLQSMRDEVAALEKVIEQGEQIAVQGALKLPAAWPTWLQAAIRWLAYPFLGMRLKTRPANLELINIKLAELKQGLATINAEMVTGILTPQTLADEAECNAYYFKTLRHLTAALPEEETPEGQRAREEAINFTTNHYLNAKRIECVLKERFEGRLVRTLTAKQAHALDPRLAMEIWQIHQAAFELSEDELGKSQAPSRNN